MKVNKSKLVVKSALTLPIVLSLSIIATRNSGVGAQQMQDMPYDLHFIDMMIMHHQEGIEMAQLAETRALKVGVKTFAAKTAAMQQKDIEELQRLRNQFYPGKPLMDPAMMSSMMSSKMEGMHGGMQMDMEDTRRKLRAAQGAAFDQLFLDTMIHHHMMAIDMAKEATTKAEHAEIRELAQQGLTSQKAEVAEMNRLKGTPAKSTKAKTKPKAMTPHMHKH